MSATKPCVQCPWRKENHGKRHAGGFYTKENLTRMWNQIRRGGGMQSCHLTDPSHPDHVASGAKAGATAKECPGSVIVVLQEAKRMARPDGTIGDKETAAYLATREKGLTKSGILYWLVKRLTLGGTLFFGGPKLPEVDVNEPGVGLPEYLTKTRGTRTSGEECAK